MRKSCLLFLAVVMFMATGCDFFRKVAGRPTSDVIEMKRLEMIWDMEEKAAAEKAYRDSVEKVEKSLRDSSAACDYIKQNGVSIILPSKLYGIRTEGLDCRYYIVIGSFKTRYNADMMLRKVNATNDYDPRLVYFGNGMMAVATCPSNRIQDVVASLQEIRKHSFCPPDAWILLNE